MVYIRKEPPPFRRAVIPKHREIKKGTLRRIIRDAGMTVDEFVSVLSKV
jgi:predicted RNA binding protein YcfA (HicA-like mRNA interferase family)